MPVRIALPIRPRRLESMALTMKIVARLLSRSRLLSARRLSAFKRFDPAGPCDPCSVRLAMARENTSAIQALLSSGEFLVMEFQ